MIEEIQHNLEIEFSMTRELSDFLDRIRHGSPEEQKILQQVIESLRKRIKLVNASVGTLVGLMSLARPLSANERASGVEKVHLGQAGEPIALRIKDKEKFLEELSISDLLIKRLKKRQIIKDVPIEEYRKPNLYAQFANRFFLQWSENLVDKGYFDSLNKNLRKGNIEFLTPTYVSMLMLSTVMALVFGIAIFVLLLFVDISSVSPFVSMYDGSYLARLSKIFWVVPALPIIMFGVFYFYPSLERKSLAGKINSELPFVVIHMGSISGSGVEPTQIFKIVGLSRDYDATRTEIRKLINQINVYGYDLITALKNVARLTPSQGLAELFNGLSTTISSGGDLKTFFEKRADTLLLSYRLEREKFTKVAETFMDIYISVVIATPMILLLLLVMISVSGVQIAGLGVGQLTFLIIFVVALINVVFLWLISLKQPSY